MEEVNEESLSGSKVTLIVLQTFLWFIGLLIQCKIIYVCWKDKEGKTWHIHLTHSIATIIYFSLCNSVTGLLWIFFENYF